MANVPDCNSVEELLVSLAVLSARTDAAEQKILDAGVARLSVVNARIEVLRPDAPLRDGDDYQALIVERGLLHRVIALARERLAG